MIIELGVVGILASQPQAAAYALCAMREWSRGRIRTERHGGMRFTKVCVYGGWSLCLMNCWTRK